MTLTLPTVGLFADAIAVKQVGSETFRLCQPVCRRHRGWMSTDEIAAIRDVVYTDCRSILSLAAQPDRRHEKYAENLHRYRSKTLVAVACGSQHEL